MENAEKIKEKEHVIAGIFGAFLFALLYAVLWVVVFIFWREDVPHWSAFLCTWFSCVGYTFLSAARKSKLSIVFGTIFGGLFTFLSHAASYFVKLFINIYGKPSGIASFWADLQTLLTDYQTLLLTRGYYARFMQQLSIALTMAFFGIILFCYTTFWTKKARQERAGIKTTILTEIWGDTPKKQEDIPASPDWIWKNAATGHESKKVPENLVQNQISSSLFDDADEEDEQTGFMPKNKNNKEGRIK